ncbi:hypothetical protein KKD19_05565 [Patescibacteria group bacterium]|nr:hypothetical protein [Patescibacteria group bacterium]MBU4512673.1 hypothetical protein [Patescibacteria group bacterium]MCG2693576.1 hypothetical protein [Candidatus Parcubacteria bacterium]
MEEERIVDKEMIDDGEFDGIIADILDRISEDKIFSDEINGIARKIDRMPEEVRNILRRASELVEDAYVASLTPVE